MKHAVYFIGKRADDPPLGLITVAAMVGLLTAETARRDVSIGRAVTGDTRRRHGLDEDSRRYAGFGHRPTSYRLTPSGNDDFLAWKRL